MIFIKLIIKINIIKINIKNINFITFKYKITKIFIKKSIFSSAYKAVKSFLIILLLAKQSATKFNVGRKSSTASSLRHFLSQIKNLCFRNKLYIQKKPRTLTSNMAAVFFKFQPEYTQVITILVSNLTLLVLNKFYSFWQIRKFLFEIRQQFPSKSCLKKYQNEVSLVPNSKFFVLHEILPFDLRVLI